ncbi:MAG: hypothetical protein EXQ94_02120 [Alphaproteobacteria bacterium]|nr:hypothetical protein [Alphaproteobacteria bacterium]
MRLAARRIAGALAILALLSGPVLAQGFVTGIDDLPLMLGLAEVAGQGTVFDKAEGRIVEAYAVGNLTTADVADFYLATLPQLGWREVGELAWRREGEELAITFEETGGGLTVRFSLAPR